MQAEFTSPAAPDPSPPNRFRALLIAGFASSILAFTSGCLGVRSHSVPKTVLAPVLMNATLDQLLAGLNKQDSAIQTINATVNITAESGGTRQGQVNEIPTFAGYIFLRKPGDLHVLMLLPVVRSRALDMVSNGTDFKLLIPPRNLAFVGKDQMTTAQKTGLYSIRPYIIRDALLIPSPGSDELIALTEDSRILPPVPGRKEMVEEPDYDLNLFRAKAGNTLQQTRVIHIGSVTLKPYQQDIYDADGHIVTTVTYDKYQKFGEVDFPSEIVITRKRDEYKLKIEITKASFNTKLDDEQFVLNIPETVPVQHVDDPPKAAAAKLAP